jgi:alpha-amylase
MGTVEQLRNMINICREKGVRIYADAVVNHMAGNGNDNFPKHCSGQTYWGAKNSSGGSPYWSQGYAY